MILVKLTSFFSDFSLPHQMVVPTDLVDPDLDLAPMDLVDQEVPVQVDQEVQVDLISMVDSLVVAVDPALADSTDNRSKFIK